MSILDKMGNGEGIEGKCKEEKKMSKVMILKKLKEVKNGSRMVEWRIENSLNEDRNEELGFLREGREVRSKKIEMFEKRIERMDKVGKRMKGWGRKGWDEERRILENDIKEW